jgi:hypothetical protein
MSGRVRKSEEVWPWHRLLGLSWLDFFWGTPTTVETEKDLSEKQQLLDILITCPEGSSIPHPLPDGFDNLGRYNLLSFKSFQEALNGFAADELVSHFVNGRKQLSPTMQNLLPLDQFRLFALSARYPQALAEWVPMTEVQPGVYEVRSFSMGIRLVVLNELPLLPHNAMLLLFSANEQHRQYAAQHYRPHSPETSTLLIRLINKYRQEGFPVPVLNYEELRRQTREEILEETPPEEILKHLTTEEILKHLTAEQILKHLTPEQLLQGLTAEKRLALAQLLRKEPPPAEPG